MQPALLIKTCIIQQTRKPQQYETWLETFCRRKKNNKLELITGWTDHGRISAWPAVLQPAERPLARWWHRVLAGPWPCLWRVRLPLECALCSWSEGIHRLLHDRGSRHSVAWQHQATYTACAAASPVLPETIAALWERREKSRKEAGGQWGILLLLGSVAHWVQKPRGQNDSNQVGQEWCQDAACSASKVAHCGLDSELSATWLRWSMQTSFEKLNINRRGHTKGNAASWLEP